MGDPVRDAFSRRKADRVLHVGADGVATDGAGRVVNATVEGEPGPAPLPGGAFDTSGLPYVESFDDLIREAADRSVQRRNPRWEGR